MISCKNFLLLALALVAITSIIHVSCRTVRICENMHGSISCPAGTNLTIMCANFGRLSADICNSTQGPYDDLNCIYPETVQAMGEQCNATYCYLSANDFVFLDYCEGTFKYLEVTYFCTTLHTGQDGSTYLVPVCTENEQLYIVNSSVPECYYQQSTSISIPFGCQCQYGYVADPMTGECNPTAK